MWPRAAADRPRLRARRLGSRRDLLAAIAEFEHDLIVERMQDGLAAARAGARGRKGGPKFKMTETRVRQARAMYDAGQHTVQQIGDTFGVSRPTIYRHLDSAPPTSRKKEASDRGRVAARPRRRPGTGSRRRERTQALRRARVAANGIKRTAAVQTSAVSCAEDNGI
jgi:Helix-turn-helix domain of resolvase